MARMKALGLLRRRFAWEAACSFDDFPGAQDIKAYGSNHL